MIEARQTKNARCQRCVTLRNVVNPDETDSHGPVLPSHHDSNGASPVPLLFSTRGCYRSRFLGGEVRVEEAINDVVTFANCQKPRVFRSNIRNAPLKISNRTEAEAQARLIWSAQNDQENLLPHTDQTEFHILP